MARKTQGLRVIRWIEAHCVFTNGKWAGEPFKLLPWQKQLLVELFETDQDGKRRYRWAYVSTSKKSGKTELAAALALYFLIGDGESSPYVICAAASEDQADLVFGAAKRMCEKSPTLSQITQCFEREIVVPTSPGAPGRLRRVAAVAGANDGLNCSAVILDELHEWTGAKGEAVWNVLTQATAVRDNPMVFQITTAGYDRHSICWKQYQHGKRVKAGDVEDPSFFDYCAEPPKDADHRLEETWIAANPSYGVTVHSQYYLDQLSKKPENVFRRYLCNQWTESSEAWLPAGTWGGCCNPEATIPLGSRIWVGLDVGIKKDTTAIALLHERGDGKVVVKAEVFTPPGDGTALDLGPVEARLRGLIDQYKVLGLVFDPRFIYASAQAIANDTGTAVIEAPQQPGRMTRATSRIYDAIIAGRIIHTGDPVLAAHVAACATKPEENGERLVKRKATEPIDAAIAMCIAYDHLVDNTSDSPYERRGLVTL